MSLFCCPICDALLQRETGCYRCATGHNFDISSSGYTHLLPPNKKKSKFPGDDKAMVASRTAFLDKGYYTLLRDTLVKLVCEDAPVEPILLDSGCGEGYYTEGIFRGLSDMGRTPKIAGVDISKFALNKAAKRLPEGEFAVASVYDLPLADGSVNLLTNVFSPLAVEEFSRLLQSDGYFYYVVPSKLHLWEMKEVLYDAPHDNTERREDYNGFVWVDITPVHYTITLDCSADIMALFGMTPYAWKTPKAGIERLATLSELQTQIGFDIHRYRKL